MRASKNGHLQTVKFLVGKGNCYLYCGTCFKENVKWDRNFS